MAKAEKIQALVVALVNKFEEKANKITSWSGTVSDTTYPSGKLVKDSLDNKENISNKKTAWNGSESDDGYPSAKLVKDSLDLKENAANKTNAWGDNPDNLHYPTAKLVYDSLATKLESADVPDHTSDLINDGSDGEHPFLTEHQSLSSTAVTVEKQATAETGYAHTYVVKQNSAQVGVKINIPKDFLVKSGEVKTASSNDLATLGNGYSAGDKYIDFVINTKGNDGTDEHIYINVKDLVEDTTYDADNSTLQLSNGTFSIKSSGVDTAQIKNSAVTTDKIADKNVTTGKIADKGVTAAKIADNTITINQIASSLSSTWITESQVETEIEGYIEDLTTALTPVSSGE